MRQFVASLIEVAEVVVIALAAVFLVRTFLFQPFLVSGASMETNFSNGDYILVDELTYRIRAPQRGEVIVFRYPKDESTYFIKRIVGLPGETVEIANNQVVIHNVLHPQGAAIHESYVESGASILSCAGREGGMNERVALGGNEYFVMGDNRMASFDSRCWGALARNEIVGVARVRLWPIAKASAVPVPSY